MKVLLNQHLSWKLKDKLMHLFEDVRHVKDIGFTQADDLKIVAWARENNYAIITKDSDYNDIIINSGPPPIVLWLRIGNCSTDAVIRVLTDNISRITIESNNTDSGIISII